MGTPSFAIPALNALIDANYPILAVYTQPPRPAGRGQSVTPSPVQLLAEQNNIPVVTPINFKQEEDRARFDSFTADVAVVAAYGLLLPRAILEAPKHGCINIHPSLLPRWRGAAPLQRALMAGDTYTAVCIMKMNEGLDTGDILLSEKLSIPPQSNAGELHDLSASIGARLTINALQQLQEGGWSPKPQADTGVTYARKITKEETRIDWQKPAREILWHIRGLSPQPGAVTLHHDTPVKILDARVLDMYGNAAPGEVMDDRLTIATGEGALQPLLVQRPGKKPMPVEDMLRGQPIPPGTRFH